MKACMRSSVLRLFFCLFLAHAVTTLHASAPARANHTPASCAQVRAGLVPLLAELRANGSPPDDAWLKGSYDVDKQVGSAGQAGGQGLLLICGLVIACSTESAADAGLNATQHAQPCTHTIG